MKKQEPQGPPAPEFDLPASVDTEKTVLGAALIDSAALETAVGKLTHEDFALDSHQRIFKIILHMHANASAVDIITVSEALRRKKELETVGSTSYLASLSENLPYRLAVDQYVRILKEKSLLRRTILICNHAVTKAIDQADNAIEIIGEVTSQLEVVLNRGTEQRAERASVYLDRRYGSAAAMMEQAAREKGLPTGFEKLDDLTCGLQKGHLIVLGGRPSMGKSGWAGVVAEHVALDLESPVAFFPLEAGKGEFLRRSACCRARVPLQAFKKGTLNERQIHEFEEAYADFRKAPLFLDDMRNGATLGAIRAQLIQLKAEQNLELAIIDQLSFLSLGLSEESRKNMTREREVATITRGLKTLATDLGIPIILVCHIKRDTTKRADPRPALSDLRESGSIEQDADEVIFVHRPEYYDRNDKNLTGKGEIILAKQRDGPTDVCDVKFDGSIIRWHDEIDETAFNQASFPQWMFDRK